MYFFMASIKEPKMNASFNEFHVYVSGTEMSQDSLGMFLPRFSHPLPTKL